MTMREFLDAIAERDGLCEICGCEPIGYPLSVDHDHTNDQVRGFICKQCNHGLGCFYDEPETLRAAADYLERARALPEKEWLGKWRYGHRVSARERPYLDEVG